MNAEFSSWRIDSGYIDARGQQQTTDPAVVDAISRLLGCNGTTHQTKAVALRSGGPTRISAFGVAAPFRWQLAIGRRTLASGQADDTAIELPSELPPGSYQLTLEAADTSDNILVLVAPPTAYQPAIFRDGGRAWLLTVQLYAIRSAQNWGHGDFTDLMQLLQIAARAGAAGIGLNPLHALAPGQASPYSPSSRSFLNPLYIDVEAVAEFPGVDNGKLKDEIERLRQLEVVDYVAVHALKRKALAAAHDVFRDAAGAARRDAFERFCAERGEPLARFVAFEAIREQRGLPWQNWPRELHDPHTARAHADEGAIAFHSYVQWIADQQLQACSDTASRLELAVGLYLDVAVGVDAGGAEAWGAPDALPQTLSIGAPPDVYNPGGQNWGLASLHPQKLVDSDFSLFRHTLRSAMRHAGAIRLDHALGLNRLFLIPTGASGASGGYVSFPFEAMLAVIAQESVACRCLVIGEDLGTIPEGVCDALNAWGIWSYRVALFERDHDAFKPPEHFPDKAIVGFNTHDLSTFAGWQSSHDLSVKAQIGLDAGETEHDRENARAALRTTLQRQGLSPELSLPDVVRYLARTRCQLLAISIEDILGLADQPNIPGTIDEHPNWRRRLPVGIEQLANHDMLGAVAAALAAEGRGRFGRR